MASKYMGVVGYGPHTLEVAPGVMEKVITERRYYGDVIRPGANFRAGETILPTIGVTNQLSLLADAYAYENFHDICYVEWAGAYWTVVQCDIVRPRLILRLGGVYHGETL